MKSDKRHFITLKRARRLHFTTMKFTALNCMTLK